MTRNNIKLNKFSESEDISSDKFTSTDKLKLIYKFLSSEKLIEVI